MNVTQINMKVGRKFSVVQNYWCIFGLLGDFCVKRKEAKPQENAKSLQTLVNLTTRDTSVVCIFCSDVANALCRFKLIFAI